MSVAAGKRLATRRDEGADAIMCVVCMMMTVGAIDASRDGWIDGWKSSFGSRIFELRALVSSNHLSSW